MRRRKPKLVVAGDVPPYALFAFFETGEEYYRLPRTMIGGEPDVVAFNPDGFVWVPLDYPVVLLESPATPYRSTPAR